jgi:hypothetical protein
MEDKTKLKEYIAKRRKETKPVDIKPVKLAWYQRPINREEFITKKGRDNKLYVRHNEWAKSVYIGPYNDTHEVNEIIKSYEEISSKMTLDKKLDNRVHSIYIENPKEFFNE